MKKKTYKEPPLISSEVIKRILFVDELAYQNRNTAQQLEEAVKRGARLSYDLPRR